MPQHQFDPWQQEAIEIADGHHLVLAPPGCGKTDILTERVVHAHNAGIEYSDMLCLTFTNRAAKGMAQRIADRTDSPVPDDLFVGNIHRFCSQMLFAEGIVNHNCTIVDEVDVENIIQEELSKQLNITCRTSELLRYQHGLRQMAMGMRGDMILHSDLFHTGGISKLCDVLGLPFTEQSLADIYTNITHLTARYTTLHEIPAANLMTLAYAYEQYKITNDLLDYDDLLILAYQHLSQPHHHNASTTLHTAAGHYRWIEVDEVQDLNSLQIALIDLLATDDATVVYLGDEQQAIFSFIGAKLETLESLKRRCHGHIHHLHTNYRSPSYLLNLQNDYAALNLGIKSDWLPSTDLQVAPQPGDLCLIDLGDTQLESLYTARLAHRYGQMLPPVDSSSPHDKVAILVSTNREADSVSETMQLLNIPHFKISGTDLFSLPSVRLLLSHLSVLTDETAFINWARIFWQLHIAPTYTAARTMIRDMRRIALLPTDFIFHPDSSFLQEFVRAYDSEELVIFDTETTGLNVQTDDIIQIAAIKVHQGHVVGHPFNIILETDKELPPLVGGLPNPMLEVYANSHRYPRAEGLRLFLDYCSGHTLVGHNVAFDYHILAHNLERTGSATALESCCPRYFDTLKYIRLVRPHLRNYKLGHLLEVLHLEGDNSHRADDDIMATLALLNFCHTNATQLIASQRLFLSQHQKLLDHFRALYAPLYIHGTNEKAGGIAEELQFAYQQLLASNTIAPIDKWQHLVHYLSTDLIRTDLYPTLHTQLERYITDITTSKEADMCGGSLQERYIISTVHKAKGLEFDSVIIYQATDDKYPGYHSWDEKHVKEDARRLFVAISRARRHLCILFDTYCGQSTHTLSPFLEKVKHHFTLYRRGSDGKLHTV